jgi:hypothetical protein
MITPEMLSEAKARIETLVTRFGCTDGSDRSALNVLINSMDEPKVETCEWKYDEDMDYYHSQCDEYWTIFEGTPKENNMKFCHGCGKLIKVKQ